MSIEYLSRPIYLFFLDRELLTSFDLYNRLSKAAIEREFRSILLFSYEPTYFSLSLAFENKFARHICQKYNLLFQRGHVELITTQQRIEDFVQYKKEQYPRNQRKRYKFYYDDTWQNIADLGVVLTFNNKDTG